MQKLKKSELIFIDFKLKSKNGKITLYERCDEVDMYMSMEINKSLKELEEIRANLKRYVKMLSEIKD